MATTSTRLVHIALFVSVFVSAAFGLRTGKGLNDAQQCRIQRLTATQPSRTLESEGGVIELWNKNEEQFQCAGVAPLRVVIRPNSIHLPSFHPTPRLAYVLQGKGLLGLNIPGCAETYTSQQPQQQQQQEQQQLQYQQVDQHQRVRRIRKGDVIAVPAGAAHWWANHGEQEDLVILTVNDLNHLANQLDQKFWEFYLAGGPAREGQQQQQQQQGQPWQQEEQGQFQNLKNLFSGFDPQLLAEAFRCPVDTIQKLQRKDERGVIVNSKQGLRSIIRPGKQEGEFQEQGEQQQEQWGGQGQGSPYNNGLAETLCTMKVHTNINQSKQADVYSRQAGKINMVDRLKMPILAYLDMSIEKGDLFPNALVTPHWTMNSHCVMYVVRGDAQVETVNYNGQNVMNDRVNEGDMIVVPQFFATTIKAGSNGLEFVAFKTSGSPTKSPLVGYTSVLRALPLDVVEHSYQVSPDEAQQLKLNRGGESILLSSHQQRGRAYK
ncbi:hypothetical protein ACH5RR_010553 [Cinchona calisaya]|uniref:Cupin type-1 domain-containing protein n=1 Tax=Cinchona calisaya TaxID=153742 RepID=A0ABD3AJB0_9GENT